MPVTGGVNMLVSSTPSRYTFVPDFEPDLNEYIDAEIFRKHCSFCRGKRRIHKPQTFKR